jgi:phosphatidate phosphatase APP1
MFGRLIFIASLLALTGCQQYIFTADDLAVMPRKPTIFVAQLETDSIGGLRDGVENHEVVFMVDGSVVGTARTDAEGRAQLIDEIVIPTHVSTYRVKTQVVGRQLTVQRPIHRWDPDRVIVVVDIDHTVSDTDYETLLTETDDTGSVPYPNSRATLRALGGHYELLYLTARPRFLLEETRTWLKRHDFPEAPLVTVRTVSEVLDQTKHKRQLLTRRKELWPNMLIGIGDKEADVGAYAATGMLGVILAPANVPVAAKNTVLLPDWSAINRFFRVHQQTLRSIERLSELLERDAGAELALPAPTRP